MPQDFFEPRRPALITGKAFAAGVKALIQAVVVIVIAALGIAAASSLLGRLAR
nr:hypothetical protein [Streptomyces sp. So13.3]